MQIFAQPMQMFPELWEYLHSFCKSLQIYANTCTAYANVSRFMWIFAQVVRMFEYLWELFNFNFLFVILINLILAEKATEFLCAFSWSGIWATSLWRRSRIWATCRSLFLALALGFGLRQVSWLQDFVRHGRFTVWDCLGMTTCWSQGSLSVPGARSR